MLLSRSLAEYCCPVWARSSYTNLIDPQLHSAMRLITGCLQPTQLPWLPVLSNVVPPSLRRKTATDNMLQVTEPHPNWYVLYSMLMSLSIHLHGLHLDAQHGQT